MSMNHETWMPCPDYEGIYEVSSCGRLKRVQGGERRQAGRILKPRKHSGGYLSYVLSKDGAVTYQLAHRLVMSAFVGKCPEGITVNHLNGDKTDNRLENLEYATQSENNFHAVRVLGKRRGEDHYYSVLTEGQVKEIRTLLRQKVGKQKIASMYGVTTGAIKGIVEGRSWRHVE